MRHKNWIIVLIMIGLFSVKFYYLYLSFMNNNYSNDMAYNGADSGHYLSIAKNIANFNVYSDTNSNIATENATWRSPFWPFVLSFLFKFTTNPLWLIMLKAILESTLILLALFKFKNTTNYKYICLLPFFLVFIEPYYLKYSTTFLSESLTSVLMFLLVVFFISLKNSKKYHIAIPILSSFVILCHPVAIFFVLSLFSMYLIFNLKSNFKVAILHGLIFSLLILAWPYRNYITFDKGFYLTASQGATFSKGWNEKVATQFTNVEGDLANESLNLKFVDDSLRSHSEKSPLDLSNLYTIGTRNFISKISFQEKMNIVFIKLKSNFNPFPEKSKLGFLENLSIFFRSLYLILFLQLLFRIFIKRKLDFNITKDRIYLVVLAVLIGQTTMSIYIYTGLRFNAIYSLTLLFCFTYVNKEFLTKIYKKVVPAKVQKLIA